MTGNDKTTAQRPSTPPCNRLQSIYLLVTAAIVGYGTFLSVTSEGYFDPSSLKYFTNQSNLLMALGYILVFILLKSRSRWAIQVRDYLSVTVLLAMLVTGLIYSLVLVPLNGNAPPLSDYTNFSTHLLAPLLALGHFLFFSERGRLRIKGILAAMAYPIVYWLIFVLIGGTIGFYPYFFMDPTRVGWTMLFVWFAALLAIFAVIGLLLLVFDGWRAKPPACD